jgi:hypothetical protein
MQLNVVHQDSNAVSKRKKTIIKVRTNPKARHSKPSQTVTVTLKNGHQTTEVGAEMIYCKRKQAVKCFHYVSDLAKWVGQDGHTIFPCIFNHYDNGNKHDYFVSTRLIIIDFDNGEKVNGKKVKFTGSDYISLHDFIKSTFARKYCAFVYESFSSTPNWNRFHAVFVLDQEIKNEDMMKLGYKRVSNLCIGKHDENVSTGMRLFFGGNKLYEINYNNELPVNILFNDEELTNVSHRIQYSYVGYELWDTKQISCLPQKVKLLASHQYDRLQAKLNMKPETYQTDSQFYHSMLKFNMGYILGLPTNHQSFFDIFEPENIPSAWINRKSNGNYYYCLRMKQFYDLFQVVKRLTNSNFTKSFKVIAKITNSKIEHGFFAKLENMDKFIESFNKDDYPATYRYFNRNRKPIGFIFKLFKQNCLPFYQHGFINWYFYMGSRGISESLYGTDRKHRQVSRLLKLMELGGLIKSVPVSHMPDFVINNITTGNRFKSNVYEICDLDPQQLEDNCKIMKSVGVTIRSISRYTVENVFGNQKAHATYRQIYQVDGDKIEKESINQKKIEWVILNRVNQDIQDHGFSIESRLYGALNCIPLTFESKKFGTQPYTKSMRIRKVQEIRGKMINKYGFKRVRLTKSLKQQLGVTDYFKSHSTPYIYMKGND